MSFQLNEDQTYNYLYDDYGAYEATAVDRSIARVQAIRPLIEGLEWSYRIMRRCQNDHLLQRIDLDTLSEAYRVMIPLQFAFKAQILEAAK